MVQAQGDFRSASREFTRSLLAARAQIKGYFGGRLVYRHIPGCLAIGSVPYEIMRE
jgi:hypothetical protein